jgi:hypothetical protein
VWLTIAVILLLEVLATVWFFRTYNRQPQPPVGRDTIAATPPPAR